MKKKFMIVLSALLIGAISAYYLFIKIPTPPSKNVNEVTLKAFQIGAFSSYDNAYKLATSNNGIVISDQEIYRVYVAILNDQEAITKLKNYYDSIGLNYYIRDVKIKVDNLEDIKLSEKLLIESSTDTYSVINLDLLKKYKELL